MHWYNEAAYKRLGNPRSGEEVLDWWEGLTPRVKPHAVEVLKTLHETIVVSSFPILLPFADLQAMPSPACNAAALVTAAQKAHACSSTRWHVLE